MVDQLRDRERKEWGGMRPISTKTAAACTASVVMLISLLGLAGTARAQVVTCVGIEERVATIVGTEGNDLITGTSGDDVIQALGGNDQIDGGDGNDLICGGAGDDIIYGGARGGGPGEGFPLRTGGEDVNKGGDGPRHRRAGGCEQDRGPLTCLP